MLEVGQLKLMNMNETEERGYRQGDTVFQMGNRKKDEQMLEDVVFKVEFHQPLN